MKQKLNNSNLVTFANIDSNIFVHGNFAIIRDVASIKNQIISTGMGELFFVPLGRILLVTAGFAHLRINLQPCKIEAGQALVIPENFYMEVQEVDQDYNANIVSFNDIDNPFKRWTTIEMGTSDFCRLQKYIDLLWQVAHAHSFQQTTIDNILIAMLSDLWCVNNNVEQNHSQTTPTAAEQLVQRFFDLLAESDGDMRSVAAFAERLFVTPNHLSTVVRQQAGQTVMQLVNAHTILQAKVLLRHSDLPVYEVADRLGFESSPAFCRFFKRETGSTPTFFRKTII